MSKITNDGLTLTRAGTGCFTVVPIIPYGNNGRQRVNVIVISDNDQLHWMQPWLL